jgi:hypothetical protein
MNTSQRIAVGLSAAALAVGALPAAAGAAPVLYGATGIDAADTSPPPASSLYAINPDTGAATAVGPIGFPITGLAADPKGTLYGATADVERSGGVRQLLTIDTKTGKGTVAGSLGTNEIEDIAFDAAGHLFGWNTTGDDLSFITLKPSVTAPVIGDSGLGVTFGGGLTFGPDGTLYGMLTGDDGNLFKINPATGTVARSWPLTGSPNTTGAMIGAAAMGCDGSLYAVVNDYGQPPTYLVTINPENGLIKTIGQTAPALDAIAFTGCPAEKTPPLVRLRSNARQRLATLRGGRFGFKLSVSEPAKLELRLLARLRKAHGGRGALRLVAKATVKQAKAGEIVTVKLKPSSKLVRRLRREKTIPALLRVKATDLAGNVTTRTKTMRFR